MNLNAQQGELASLQNTYTSCLHQAFNHWMSSSGESKEQEWCSKEKHDYLNYMRKNLPTQYENLMRLEENNIWSLQLFA